jgi:hypothetical protein
MPVRRTVGHPTPNKLLLVWRCDGVRGRFEGKKQMQVASRYASELLIFARFNNLIVTVFRAAALQPCIFKDSLNNGQRKKPGSQIIRY